MGSRGIYSFRHLSYYTTPFRRVFSTCGSPSFWSVAREHLHLALWLTPRLGLYTSTLISPGVPQEHRHLAFRLTGTFSFFGGGPGVEVDG